MNRSVEGGRGILTYRKIQPYIILLISLILTFYVWHLSDNFYKEPDQSKVRVSGKRPSKGDSPKVG